MQGGEDVVIRLSVVLAPETGDELHFGLAVRRACPTVPVALRLVVGTVAAVGVAGAAAAATRFLVRVLSSITESIENKFRNRSIFSSKGIT